MHGVLWRNFAAYKDTNTAGQSVERSYGATLLLIKQSTVGHKISCLKTLFSRINTQSRIPESKKIEERKLYNVFHTDLAPNFVRRYIQQTTWRQQPLSLRNGKKHKWRPISYISTVSEETARILATNIIKVTHKPISTLRSQQMKPKTSPELSEKSAVDIDCKNGPANYVGEIRKARNQISWTRMCH